MKNDTLLLGALALGIYLLGNKTETKEGYGGGGGGSGGGYNTNTDIPTSAPTVPNPSGGSTNAASFNLPNTSTAQGPVYVAPGSNVPNTSTMQGPVYVAPGSNVPNTSTIHSGPVYTPAPAQPFASYSQVTPPSAAPFASYQQANTSTAQGAVYTPPPTSKATATSLIKSATVGVVVPKISSIAYKMGLLK